MPTDSDEFKQISDHVQELQKHVESLYSSLNSLRQETARLAPLQERPILPPPSVVSTPSPSASSSHRPPPHLPFRVPSFFNGPTSLAFTVDVAKDTLHKMGYSGVGDGQEDHGAQPDTAPHASPQMTNAPSGVVPPPSQGPADPLWEFDESEIVRLMRVYQEEVDVMYPVTSMGPVMAHVRYISSWMDTARRAGGVPSPGLEQVLQDPKTLLVKILMCCALVVTEHGNSDKAVRIYDSIQPLVDKMLMSSPADVSQLAFLALCSGYRFLSNDEVLAWRLVGQVARHCFELGLHRREGIQKIADPQIRRDALHTFWSMYVLDRRWSFSTGLPFVCHDDKIDPKLPYPEGYPFLMAMIGYSRVAAKIWRLVDYFEPAVVRELKPHDFEQLDREIMEWYDSVPEEVRTGPLDGDQMSLPSGPYDLQRLRIWTRLRLNQVRIWLYTPVLHSATSISQNAQLARKVVDLAKQTIRILTHLNNETDQYRRIQVFYHQFLTSSIGVLFLASTHAPLQFSVLCRDEFYMALDLVKGLSSRSWVSHRLWRTIRSLQAYAPKLGLSDNSNRAPTGGSRSPYARASSSTTGHHSPALPRPFDSGPPSRPGSVGPAAMHSPVVMTPVTTQPMHMGEALSNGLQLQNEMSQIFEGYIGMTSKGQSSGNELGPAHRADMGYGGMGLSPMRSSGSEEPTNAQGSVYQYVKDIF
ncbi:hypothetical protein B0J18DRAFT_412214 [Chaetomium sp. MPI-SDFR-AT-0129]|nr:hypothetical protein B0J18DRAFT_412214 [Chaetomium sp. MPI-SDFR-AT-0129]